MNILIDRRNDLRGKEQETVDEKIKREIEIMNSILIEVECNWHIIDEVFEWLKLHGLESEYIISNDFQIVKNKRKNSDMWICNEIEELLTKYEEEYKNIKDNITHAENEELLAKYRTKRDIMSDIIDDLRKVLY